MKHRPFGVNIAQWNGRAGISASSRPSRSGCSRSSPSWPGRSLTHRLDFGRHVASPSYAGADYYPILLAVVKGGIALLLARLALAPASRARSAERAALRLLGGAAAPAAPAVRALGRALRSRSSLLTSVIYLVQTDAEGAEAGRWPLLSPWLHSSALPVFAVLAVLCALVWGAVRGWLADYEEYAQATVARAALRLVGRARAARRRGRASSSPFRLAASSGWRSRAVRLRSLRNSADAP